MSSEPTDKDLWIPWNHRSHANGATANIDCSQSKRLAIHQKNKEKTFEVTHLDIKIYYHTMKILKFCRIDF